MKDQTTPPRSSPFALPVTGACTQVRTVISSTVSLPRR